MSSAQIKNICICEANKIVSADVKNFLINLPDVKEESITDYLIWKWRELDKRFKYIRISTFTRHKESTTTGADFELELWLVGKRFHYSLVFQAKKFIDQYDSYVNKLNYPRGTQDQLKTLLNYSKKKNKLPFYAIYSMPDEKTLTMCGMSNLFGNGVFMVDAYNIKKFADGFYGKRVSKNDILNKSNPFHCMFCCPLIQSVGYFHQYFPSLYNSIEPRENEQLPQFVRMILSDRMSNLDEQEALRIIDQNELRVFRAIGVYDLQNIDGIAF